MWDCACLQSGGGVNHILFALACGHDLAGHRSPRANSAPNCVNFHYHHKEIVCSPRSTHEKEVKGKLIFISVNVSNVWRSPLAFIHSFIPLVLEPDLALLTA